MLSEWIAFGLIIIFGLIGTGLGISLILTVKEMGKGWDRVDVMMREFSQNMAYLSLCRLYSLHGNGD